jgi:hypothetical protein
MNKVELSFGELFVAIVLASVPAILAAIAGFVGAIVLCGRLFTDEMTEWGLILGPVAALIVGAIVFVTAFRWVIHHGDPG